MSRHWTCRKCKTRSERRKQKCPSCGQKRPATRKPAHLKALDDPYEVWVEKYGEVCGICGRAPSANRRLDRDHCHASGRARGLLCFRCNKALAGWVDPAWLRKAADYLERVA